MEKYVKYGCCCYFLWGKRNVFKSCFFFYFSSFIFFSEKLWAGGRLHSTKTTILFLSTVLTKPPFVVPFMITSSMVQGKNPIIERPKTLCKTLLLYNTVCMLVLGISGERIRGFFRVRKTFRAHQQQYDFDRNWSLNHLFSPLYLLMCIHKPNIRPLL